MSELTPNAENERRRTDEERQQAQDELATSHQRTINVLESITDAFFTLDAGWLFTYINAQAERLLSRSRHELLGKCIWDEFPAAVGTAFDRQYHDAVDRQTSVTFEEYYPPPLDAWFEVRAYPSADGLSVFFHDITQRIVQLQREQFLADLAERARGLSDPDKVIADAVRSVGEFLAVSRCIFADIDIDADTCTVRPDYRADDSVASIEGVVPISAFGPFVVAEYAARRAVAVADTHNDPIKAPPGTVAAYDAISIRAHITVPAVHTGRIVSCMSVHNSMPRHWKQEEMELLQAVVERTWLTVEVLRQQQALVREAEETKEAQSRTAAILRSITDAFISLDTQWHFTYVNDQADRIMSRGRDEVMEKNFWEVFPHLVGTVFDERYHHAMQGQMPVSFETFYPTLDAWLDVRVYPSVDGLSIFFQDVSPRKRAEAERERLLAEQRARTEREVLINRIGASLRSSSDPEVIQAAAASLLGAALGADRCYFALYDLMAGTVRISPDWHREDLPSVQGIYPFANTLEMFHELYAGSNTSVIIDSYTSSLSAQTLANMESLQLRSRVSVALADKAGLTATLTAAMSDGPRDWTAEEMSLVEAAATQLRIGVEAARVQQREHRIATDLQNALQPSLPQYIPGLSVGKFTRPALDEAQIGGDFYDIFPLDKELYALVLGDVSGKGLAAAQQLALIRNSLRTTLYLYRTPAQAAATLNGIVTAHDLLVGFVTAFVAVYDSATGQIVYCSCGHEPGLIRRAGGALEVLETMGPPLGVAENAMYSETSVTLLSGDRLLLYTDGISEAGPSRREMLGTEGLMRVLGALQTDLSVQDEIDALVAEVNAFTNGVFRDDVAVLLARRQ